MTNERSIMKIVVIGGSGLIGSKLVTKLGEHGHKAVAASPNSGVNTLTGEGLAEVLKGASVVVDVTNLGIFPCNFPTLKEPMAPNQSVSAGSIRPGSRVMTSCNSQPLPSGSRNEASER